MIYRLTLEMKYHPKGVASNLELVAKAEEEICKGLDGRSWEYKTIGGLERRLKFLLKIRGSGIDEKLDSNRMEINHPIQGRIKIAKRLPNYPLQILDGRNVERLMNEVELKTMVVREKPSVITMPLNFFYPTPIERYRECGIRIEIIPVEGILQGEGIPGIVDEVTQIIYKLKEKNKGKFPSEKQLVEALGRVYRGETVSLIQEVYYGIKEGEGL